MREDRDKLDSKKKRAAEKVAWREVEEKGTELEERGEKKELEV